jgi:hypothetical protein
LALASLLIFFFISEFLRNQIGSTTRETEKPAMKNDESNCKKKVKRTEQASTTPPQFCGQFGLFHHAVFFYFALGGLTKKKSDKWNKP